MTHHPEMRFRCDGCHAETTVPMNDQTALDRGKPPEGWTVMWITSTTTPAAHLCNFCSAAFSGFMKGLAP